jgi:hypothetical protein
MEIYDAIMKAADHIEKNPHSFVFSAIGRPRDLSCIGCAIGWVAHFFYADRFFLFRPRYINAACHRMFGISDGVFYGRMDDDFGNFGWLWDARMCANNLRLYAAKYHAPLLPARIPILPARTGIPDSVRAIFTTTAQA